MSADSRLRLFCLWLIVFQNSSLILVTSYSRTLVPAYLPSVAVFLSELMKLAAVISLLAYETPGGVSEAIRQCVSLVRDTPHETAQFAVPALCYTLQNNLWYHALSNLDPVTAAVTSQLKVFTTAIASVVMLGRRVNTKQWGALTLLMGGMVLMQLKGGSDSGGDDESEGGGADVVSSVPPRSVPQNTWHGALAMLGSTMLSAYAGVYLERLFKTVQQTLWLQSVQLSLFSAPVSAVCMMLYDHEALYERNLLVGFSWLIVLAVSLNALGGIAVSMALKYADNIQKTFAVGISIVLNCLVSTLFLGVTLTSRAVLGVSMVVASTVCFNRAAESATYSSTSELDETAYREVALVNPDEDIDLGTRESPEPRRAARGTAA